MTATHFRNVFQVKPAPVPVSFPKFLAELEHAARIRQPDAAIQELLRKLPIDYRPQRTEAVPMTVAN